MLETIRKKIESVRELNFTGFFSEYVMSVQDRNIELEMKYLLKHNTLENKSVDYLIQNTYKGLKEIYEYNSNILTSHLQ